MMQSPEELDASLALKSIARNSSLKSSLQQMLMVYSVLWSAARRFVTGETRQEGVDTAKVLAAQGYGVSTVTVNDQDGALAFYVNQAGFEKRIDNAFGPLRFVVVAPRGSRTGIVLQAAQANQKATGGPTGIVLGSSDVEGTYQELSSRGLTFTQKPTRQPWGAVEAIFSDPDGNSFSLNSI